MMSFQKALNSPDMTDEQKHSIEEIMDHLMPAVTGWWPDLGQPAMTAELQRSLIEGVALYEELGRALAPVTHFVSAVMSGGVLAAAGSEAQKDQWLRPIAAGEAIVTPAWLEPENGFSPRGVEARAVAEVTTILSAKFTSMNRNRRNVIFQAPLGVGCAVMIAPP